MPAQSIAEKDRPVWIEILQQIAHVLHDGKCIVVRFIKPVKLSHFLVGMSTKRLLELFISFTTQHCNVITYLTHITLIIHCTLKLFKKIVSMFFYRKPKRVFPQRCCRPSGTPASTAGSEESLAELINTSLLQRLPHVSLTALAMVVWCFGCVMTQQ